MDKGIENIIKDLIYHGRHFSPKRDDIVIKKTLNYFNDLLKKEFENCPYRNGKLCDR